MNRRGIGLGDMESQDEVTHDEETDFFSKAIYPATKNVFTIVYGIFVIFSVFLFFSSFPLKIPIEYMYIIIQSGIIGYIIVVIYYWSKLKFKKEFDKNTQAVQGLGTDLKKILEQLTIKDPFDPINQNLTYLDVEFAIYCLVKKIRASNFFEFSKDENGERTERYNMHENLIVGIDRGGAIVGGLLGKSLVLPVVTMGIRYAMNNPLVEYGHEQSGISKAPAIDYNSNLKNVDLKHVKNILLVDDATRTGKAMETAINYLLDIKKNNKEYKFKIKTACILKEEKLKHSQVKAIEYPNFYVYTTQKSKIFPPWDLTHVWDDQESYQTLVSNPRFDNFCHRVGSKK